MARLIACAPASITSSIETVGVGQDEIEIAGVAEVTVVVLVPGMGDDVQAIKAGIMEIADVFVINKADHPGADRTARENCRRMLNLGHGREAVAICEDDRDDGGGNCGADSRRLTQLPRRDR